MKALLKDAPNKEQALRSLYINSNIILPLRQPLYNSKISWSQSVHYLEISLYNLWYVYYIPGKGNT